MKRGPKGIRTLQFREQAKPSYKRLWIGGGLVALALFLAWWLFWPAGVDKGAVLPPGAVQTPSGEIIQSPAPGFVAATVPEAAPAQETGSPFIRSVRLLPPQPTRQDTVRVEITPAAEAPPGLTYRYEWKVNDGVVADATGETLRLAELKIRDRILVTVTPETRDAKGFPVASPEVVVHPVAPTLDLELKRPAPASSGPSELQLVSVAPDSTRLTFSLEPPLVSGMTIDKATGKITWPRPPDLKGVFLFGASVEDEYQTKVTRTFEVTLK